MTNSILRTWPPASGLQEMSKIQESEEGVVNNNEIQHKIFASCLSLRYFKEKNKQKNNIFKSYYCTPGMYMH